MSEIVNFFRDQTVFIVGGTGFLGKVLVEKLLRVCKTRRIYVLIRSKKNKLLEERIASFFDFPLKCFDALKKEDGNFREKIRFVTGSCDLPNLGLSDRDVSKLTEEVSVVVHAAASVKFDQPLKEAAITIARSTKDLLDLAKKMVRLQVFVYVSTAFSNCPWDLIEEKFYPPPLTYRQLQAIVDVIDEEALIALTPKLLGKWPNTYVYTKSVTEDMIRVEGKNLPVIIIRPAIIIPSLKEPVPGWIDNFYGITGIMAAASVGMLRVMSAKKKAIAYVVPCDYVVNNILAAGWKMAMEKENCPVIYNFVGSNKNLQNWEISAGILWKHILKQPPLEMFRYPDFVFIENDFIYRISKFLFHTLVAYIADFIFICVGKEPAAVINFRKLDVALELTSYFRLREWKFLHTNLDKLWKKMGEIDQKLFTFNMDDLDWHNYLKICETGGRIFLLNDPLTTIPKARKKLYVLRVIHYIIIFSVILLVIFLFRTILKLFF